MSKSWKQLLGSELAAWAKTGAMAGKEITETCVNEIGHLSAKGALKLNINPKSDLFIWALEHGKSRRSRQQ